MVHAHDNWTFRQLKMVRSLTGRALNSPERHVARPCRMGDFHHKWGFAFGTRNGNTTVLEGIGNSHAKSNGKAMPWYGRLFEPRNSQEQRLVMDPDHILTANRNAWNRVAPQFYGRTALPEYGPLTATEHKLQLLGSVTGLRALELGCGSGHSLRYLAHRGASELWGIDLSPVQLDYARETLSGVSSSVHLIESAMERASGLPSDHFDLVFSIYGIGWTTDLVRMMSLVATWLRPGGRCILSGEHPAYSCVGWSGAQYEVVASYFVEGPQEHPSWKDNRLPTVIHRRTLATFINAVAAAGLRIDALLESPMDDAAVRDEHVDPGRWYSVGRARLFPTTFIIKATKPGTDAGGS